MLIERVTILYRSLLPIIPWYYFLLGTVDGVWFSSVLFIAYVVFKVGYLSNLISSSVVSHFSKRQLLHCVSAGSIYSIPQYLDI